MGCVPDKTLARYGTFTNQQPETREQEQEQGNSHNSHHLSVNSNCRPIAQRPFAKVYRSCRKKTDNSPLKLQVLTRNPQNARKSFSAQKWQSNNVEETAPTLKQEERAIGRCKRAKGNTFEQPHRPHVITRIETPSESIKTSFLSNLQNHPSHFFLQNNTKEIDLVFRGQLSAKEQSTSEAYPPEQPGHALSAL